jgi:hypothetical protein
MTFDQELSKLHTLSVRRLRERYAEIFGEPTTANNKPCLIRRIAWRLRERAEGGLSERAKRQAAELADDADLRIVPVRIATAPARAPRGAGTPSNPRIPPPGSTISRVYKGRTLEVRVRTDGFEYDGTVYRSLSAVANAITGSHLNGRAFFDLGDKAGGKR